LRQELGVRSAFDDAPFVHDEDLVCLEDCGEAVRDDDRSEAAEGNFKCRVMTAGRLDREAKRQLIRTILSDLLGIILPNTKHE
jgi:hypothetical protein